MNYRKIISLFLIELIILLPIAIAESLDDDSADTLFVDTNIPDSYTSNILDVRGMTFASARVSLYVNDAVPRELTAADGGSFVFPDVVLDEGSNTIRVVVKSGLDIVEESYSVMVDTVLPIVVLTEISDVVMSEMVLINGSVNKFVNISIFVEPGDVDEVPPSKVEDLTVHSIEANLIELRWTELDLDDFKGYIIYRDGSPFATIEDINYDTYPDILVNSNIEYTYEVAAMDTAGNIGPRSDMVSATTLEGGLTNRPAPEVIDPLSELNKPMLIIETDNLFSEEVDIGAEDGFYRIKIEVVDNVGNQWVYSDGGEEGKLVLLDTEDPEIEIISPESNAEIFENYADAVTIRGRTEPGARVYLYIKRTPFGVIDDVFDVSGLADGLLEISESDIRANCRFDIEGKEQCSTHADYEAIADAEGYFELEDVDFTSMYAGAYRITLYDTGDAYYDLADHESLRDFIETNLFFLAVDAAGRKGYEQVDYEIATCWSTDYTWSSRPLPEYQSPTWLNIERLKDGTEAIYFYFNFTYLGGADDAVITNLDVSKACGSGYLEDQDNYGYSCDILGSCTEKMSPTGKTAYVACPLRAIDGIEEWTEDDWDSFIGAIEHEMSFPFKLNINYDEYNNGVVAESGKVHSLCTEVTYIVDATHINPQDILPDWLLYDFVDDLNTTITYIDDWIVKVKKVLEFAAFGCMVSFITKLAVQIYRRVTCTYDEFWKKIERLGMGSDEEDLCRQCIVDKEDVDVLKKFDDKKDVQDEISDTCLKECYPSCSGAWDSESSLYSAFRWSCDRVFGHASPSGWTESATDSELFQKVSQGKGCADDQSVRGRPFRAVKCRSLEDKYRISGTFGPEDKCLEINSNKNGRRVETLYHISGPYSEGENVWTISKADTSAPSLEYDFVIKQNDDYYLGPMEQTCEQLCQGELTGESISVGELSVSGQKFEVKDPKKLSKKQEVDIKGADKKDVYEMVTGCLTPNQCVSYRSGDQRTIQLTSGDESKDIEVMTALPMGYSQDCFAPEYISSNPDERVECCCINSKQGGFSQFYQPGEVEPFDTSRHEEMEWSYRYSKIKYKNKEYNKDRYISGRDQMACFGQNHWIYDFGTSTVTGNLLIMDPMKDHLAAFQCIAISQILNRLARFKTMLSALKNCLLSIRTTGNADTGVCKELFTQYVCSFIWKIITWIRSGCLPFGKGVDFSKSDSGVLRAVSVGLSGVWDSVGDSQVELANEYGNAKLNNLLGGTEEEVFRKICLSAFGYDWEIDFENLLDIAYTAPFATLVRPVLQSREFLTIDPVSFNSIYDYRASWMISPGCDLDNYDVYLTCVTRSDMQDNGDINCAKQNDPYGRNCDCLDLSSSQAPQPEFFYQSESNIKQNELIQVDSTMIDGRIKTSPYRYDHLMFRLRVDRNMDDLGDPSQCFPQGHDDGIFYFPIIDFTGMEFAGCSLDVPSGVFSCRKGASFFYGGGTITIDGIELGDNGGDGSFNDEVITSSHTYGTTYYAGEAIEGKVKFSKDEGKQCLVVRLYDKNSQPFQSGKASEMEVISLDETGEGLVTSFRTSYTVEADDILIPTGSIEVVPEEGFSGNPGMIKFTNKYRSQLLGADFSVRFKDTDNDDEGEEYYVVQTGDEGMVKDLNENNPLYLGGFAVQFIRPWVGTEGTHTYTIRTRVDESSTVNTGLTEWLLHVDVRTPKGNDDCNDVSGFEYDGSQVVVVDGTKQSFDIPILLNPNSRRSEETCADKYSIEEITKEKDCICGRSTTENCAEGSYKYCVDDMCRRYPACVSGENNEPCVCSGSGINLNEYDCAYRNDESSADFYERGDKEAKYCVDKRCVKEVGSDFVPSPTILLGESRIEETVQGASRMVFFRADSIVSVQSKFNVEIVVDGNGHDVGKVEVIIGERESVELELQPPADKKKGIWTKEVDLHNVNNMEELRFSVRATTGSKVTNSDIVGIKIVGIAE